MTTLKFTFINVSAEAKDKFNNDKYRIPVIHSDNSMLQIECKICCMGPTLSLNPGKLTPVMDGPLEFPDFVMEIPENTITLLFHDATFLISTVQKSRR